MEEIDLSHLEPVAAEQETSQALIRGIAARFNQFGYRIGGFDAYTTSAVMKGGGLSSSAAFEVLIGTVLNHLYNGGLVDPQRIAQVGQYAENVYFGKQCGLMDQMVSAVGGFVSIDFGEELPKIRQIPFDFSKVRHHLCVTEVGSGHENLSGEYSAIPAEMKAVAACFGQEVLSRVSEEDFYIALPQLHGRSATGPSSGRPTSSGRPAGPGSRPKLWKEGIFPAFWSWCVSPGCPASGGCKTSSLPRTPPASRCLWRCWPASICSRGRGPAGFTAGALPAPSRPLCRRSCCAVM